jgi:DivIVA domain-containing protein
MSDDLVLRIQHARFTPTRLRQGYDMVAVDALLDQLCDALTAGRPIEPVIASARFAVVKMREGYDIREVDDFLASVGTPGRAAPTPQPTSPQTQPSAIQEVDGSVGGFLKRLFGSRRS